MIEKMQVRWRVDLRVLSRLVELLLMAELTCVSPNSAASAAVPVLSVPGLAVFPGVRGRQFLA